MAGHEFQNRAAGEERFGVPGERGRFGPGLFRTSTPVQGDDAGRMIGGCEKCFGNIEKFGLLNGFFPTGRSQPRGNLLRNLPNGNPARACRGRAPVSVRRGNRVQSFPCRSAGGSNKPAHTRTEGRSFSSSLVGMDQRGEPQRCVVGGRRAGPRPEGRHDLFIGLLRQYFKEFSNGYGAASRCHVAQHPPLIRSHGPRAVLPPERGSPRDTARQSAGGLPRSWLSAARSL